MLTIEIFIEYFSALHHPDTIPPNIVIVENGTEPFAYEFISQTKGQTGFLKQIGYYQIFHHF